MKTLEKALKFASPGDVVTLLPGIHYLTEQKVPSGRRGKGITLRGIRGRNGQYLSILDGGKEVKNWKKAPEIGSGVWRADLAAAPACVTVDGRQIVLIGRRRMNLARRKVLPGEIVISHLAMRPAPKGYDRSQLLCGLDVLSLPEDTRVFCKQIDYKMKHKEPFWPVVQCVAGWYKGQLYCRFADGRDPGKHVIRAGEGRGLVLENAGFVTVEDLEIRNVKTAITITGKQASDNRILRNRLRHGVSRVEILEGAARNLVEDNWISLDFIGAKYLGMQTPRASWLIYLTFKYLVSDQEHSADTGVDLLGAGSDNTVRGNIVSQGLIGIGIRSSGHTVIENNVVRNMASVGINCKNGSFAHVRGNLLIDSGIYMRFHAYHWYPQTRRNYIYKNFFYQSTLNGMQMFFLCGKQHPDSDEAVWICNNTFYGSNYLLNPSAFEKNYGNKRQKIYLLNNIVNQRKGHIPPVEIFAGNVMRKNWNERKFRLNSSYGNNFSADMENEVFAEGSGKDFPVPPVRKSFPFRGKGIDAGKDFSINGKKYSAVPSLKGLGNTPGAGEYSSSLAEKYRKSQSAVQ
ncbi:MAG: hypothetical protein IKC65_09320 [Lentisphaeria bacterium]|nr:hypothetical protein [Lentisphaeria bacterium]